MGIFDDIPDLPGTIPPSGRSPLQLTVTRPDARTARGSWYSQYRGVNDWRDPGDRPGSNALGVPDERQGIALPSRGTLGQWFDVAGPDGSTYRLQQTDVGPAKWTGRGIDISAAAADRMGYTPKDFPTDAPFSYRPAPGPPPATPIGSAMAGEAQARLPPNTGGLFDDIPDLPADQPRQVGPVEAFTTGAEQGFTANFGDELRGLRAAGGIGDYVPGTLVAKPAVEGLAGLARLGYEYFSGGDDASKRYAQARDEFRQRVKLSEEQRPGLALAGNLAGALALPLPGALAARGAGIGSRIASGALAGGTAGAVAGAGQGEDIAGRAAGAAQGAAGGALIGGALGPLAGRAAPVAQASPGMDAAAAARRLGVSLPRAAASDRMAVQQAGMVSASAPLVGLPLRRASERAVGQLDEAAGRVERGYGAGDAAQAGSAVREGITNYIKTDTARRADALYKQVDALIDPTIRATLKNTQNQANAINAKRSSASLGGSKAVDEVASALSQPGGLTYEGVKTLRTHIGEMLSSPNILPSGTSQAELKSIYGALTDDLRAAVRTAGTPRAVAAFDRANRYYALVSERREALAKVLGTRSDEAIFRKVLSSASAGAGADIATLARVRKSIGQDAWNELSSAVVSSIGRDAGGNLTPDRFVTAFGKLSPEGKSMLFRSTGKADLADALDDISTVMTRFKSLDKFANPPRTGQTVAGLFGFAAAFVDPLTVVGSAVSMAGLSAFLSRPVSARAIAKWSNAYANAAAGKPGSAQALVRATNALSITLAQDAGRPELAGELMRKLQGTSQMRADENP